jgi:hypothetical protein
MKREQAQKAINLMREMAERNAKEEGQKSGLIILDAKFGQMLDDRPGSEQYPMLTGEKLIDVSVPLQSMVNDSKLRIYSGKVFFNFILDLIFEIFFHRIYPDFMILAPASQKC